MNLARAMLELAPDGTMLERLLVTELADPLEELEGRLADVVHGPGPLDAIAKDFFAAGGKRLRALATFAVGEAFEVERDATMALAEAVELTHGATLLHDDVIDEADTRRGRVAARRRWTNTLSVLGGDFMLLRAQDRVAELGSPALRAAHRETLDELLSAEVEQHLAQRRRDRSVSGYLNVARGKTGSLFAFACASPALLAGDEGSAEALRDFGLAFGVAFQVADDVRDLCGCLSTEEAGKPLGLDLADGVPSLPLRLATRQDRGVAEALEAFAARTPLPDEVETVATLVRASGALEHAVTIGREHLTAGRARLEGLSRANRLTWLVVACDWLDSSFERLAASVNGG